MRGAFPSAAVRGQAMMEYVLLLCLLAVPLLILFMGFFMPGEGYRSMGLAFTQWFQGLGRAVSLPIP